MANHCRKRNSLPAHFVTLDSPKQIERL